MHSKCKISPYAPKENLVIDIGYNLSESGVLPDIVLFGGTACYLVELYSHIVCYLAELFLQIAFPNIVIHPCVMALGQSPKDDHHQTLISSSLPFGGPPWIV